MNDKRKLKMRFAGRFIELLGHQMYGGAVPAVVELIANSWDADAPKVEVTVPENPKADGAEIIVKDGGEGMTFDELNLYYLHIGHERRKTRGERTKSGRLVMGRKGIGKLAGFGVAQDVILRSVKNGYLVQFSLNYEELKSKEELGGYEFEPEMDGASNDPTGVTVIMKNLKLGKRINIEDFRKSIARRFALNTDKMQIIINNRQLTKENLDFEHRVPEQVGEWMEEEIPGFGEIGYWFGFLKDTIKDKELRGITVFARDRVAQYTPFFFNLSGGIHGQVGLEYLTGQVKADPLDEQEDYIATHRQSVHWDLGKAQILEAWGQNKIKELCKGWKERKDTRNIDRFKHQYSEFFPRINALAPQEKKDVTSALEKIATLDRMEPEDFRIIANSLISGVERESVKKVIKKINAASEDALPELYEAIAEWDVISAVLTAEVIVGKIEIIKKFKQYINERLPEKKPCGQIDMQTFIKDHPWLLGHEYEHLKPADFHHEHGVDKWIEEVLKATDREFARADKREGRRFDLLCIKDALQIVIIELMRPGEHADFDHVKRLELYVRRVKRAIDQKGTGKAFENKSVFGILIADDFAKDPSLADTIQDNRHLMDAFEWKTLFELVQERYREFLQILELKAPEDPRIKGLVNFA